MKRDSRLLRQLKNEGVFVVILLQSGLSWNMLLVAFIGSACLGDFALALSRGGCSSEA